SCKETANLSSTRNRKGGQLAAFFVCAETVLFCRVCPKTCDKLPSCCLPGVAVSRVLVAYNEHMRLKPETVHNEQKHHYWPAVGLCPSQYRRPGLNQSKGRAASRWLH